MQLTNEDKLRAIKISQHLQDYFDQNPGCDSLRSTDAFDILQKSGLVEWDRHRGLKFRQFLHKLVKHGAIDLIPQCRFERATDISINWYFDSTPGKTVKARNLKPISELNKPTILDHSAIAEFVDNLPPTKNRSFMPHEQIIRKKFPRADEYWSKEEEDLLQRVFQEERRLFKLSELFKRQPSAIENRLKQLGADL